MVEKKRMVMLPAAVRQELVTQLVDEYSRHLEDPSIPLRTNEEWGTTVDVSESTIRRILKGAAPDIFRERTRILRAQAVTAAYQAGTGTFGVNPETGVRFITEGGRRGGAASAAIQKENQTGIFGLTHEEYVSNGSAGGQIGGAIARDNKLGAMALSSQELSEIGAKNFKEGKGLGAINPKTGKTYREEGAEKGNFGARLDDAVKFGQINGRLLSERGGGIHGLSPHRRSAQGITNSERLTENKVLHGENYYDSYQEAAVADLLAKYIPGFTIQRGTTYQIHNGIYKKIDFFVMGLFLEYNPIILFKGGGRGSFATVEEYEQFKTRLNLISDERDRVDFLAAVRTELLTAYIVRRREALNENPDFRNNELVVATSAQDLFDLIMVRFGSNLPNKSEFIKEFNRLIRGIKRENVERRLMQGEPETT